MGFIKDLGAGLGSLLFGGVGALLGSRKKTKLIQPREVTRDQMAETVAADDALRRRKGAAADMITGVRGAEAGGAGIGRLVTGS